MALASVCASLALLALVLPAEIDRRDDDLDEVADGVAGGPANGAVSATSTATAKGTVSAKGDLAGPRVVVDGRSISAVTIGEGFLATSIDEVASASSITVEGATTGVELIGTDPDTGIAILFTPGWRGTSVFADLPTEVRARPSMSTVHADGTVIPCHPSLETATRTSAESTPIITDAPIDGATVVADDTGAVIGVAVATGSGTWMHSRTVLERALARATAAG